MPKTVIRARSLRRLNRLNASTRPSTRTRPRSANVRVTRRLVVENSTRDAGVARDERAVDDRPRRRALNRVRAGRDVERQRGVALQHAAQLEAVRERSHAVVAGVIGELIVPLTRADAAGRRPSGPSPSRDRTDRSAR